MVGIAPVQLMHFEFHFGPILIIQIVHIVDFVMNINTIKNQVVQDTWEQSCVVHLFNIL